MELVGIKPRKAWYLVFIAERLENLPAIRAEFDAGKLSWTKATRWSVTLHLEMGSGSMISTKARDCASRYARPLTSYGARTD